MSKKCISCVSRKNNNKISATTKKRADWKLNKGLKTIFPNDKIPSLKGLKESIPKGANQIVELKLGKKNANRFILYYASQEQKLSNLKIYLPSEAYGNFKNKGIAKLDKDGNGILRIKCPRPYNENNITYSSHVHFILSNEKNTEWINKMFTQTVVCHLSFNEVSEIVKNNSALLLNALPNEYYIKSRIPMSISLDHNLTLTKINEREVRDYIQSVLPHCPKINKKVLNGSLNLLDIPIVTYCYNERCEADLYLQQKLNKIGFTNVKVYSGGIIEWNKMIKKNQN